MDTQVHGIRIGPFLVCGKERTLIFNATNGTLTVENVKTLEEVNEVLLALSDVEIVIGVRPRGQKIQMLPGISTPKAPTVPTPAAAPVSNGHTTINVTYTGTKDPRASFPITRGMQASLARVTQRVAQQDQPKVSVSTPPADPTRMPGEEAPLLPKDLPTSVQPDPGEGAQTYTSSEGEEAGTALEESSLLPRLSIAGYSLPGEILEEVLEFQEVVSILYGEGYQTFESLKPLLLKIQPEVPALARIHQIQDVRIRNVLARVAAERE